MPILPAQREILWADLASTDPATNFSASSALFDGGKVTVAFLRDRLLTHEKSFGNEEQQRLLKQLADPDYKERAKAFVALKKIGRQAEPILREALRTEKDEIMHLRLRAFLGELEGEGIVTPKDEKVQARRENHPTPRTDGDARRPRTPPRPEEIRCRTVAPTD